MQRDLNMFPDPHQPPQPFPNPFSAAPTSPPRESTTAVNDDSTNIVPRDPATVCDGASIEVARRPRGRPPGSKNKPKPPTIPAARDGEPAMSPYVLEIPGGSNIVEAISRFCSRRNTGLYILQAIGYVADVTLRQPSSAPVPFLTFRGQFEILSASANFLPHTTSFSVPNELVITLKGSHGQIIFGGVVTGALMSVGIVYVIAGSFNNPSYHRLPSEDDSDIREDQLPPISTTDATVADSGRLLPIYGAHPSSDIIWTPPARQPPPHHR